VEEIRIEASIENVDRLISILDEKLERQDCPFKAQMQLDVAVEEIFGNICHYAYKSKGEVCIQLSITEDMAQICFIDSGIPFNPLNIEELDVVEVAKSEKLGGLGIIMVKESMDDCFYEYKDNKNYLTITKRLL